MRSNGKGSLREEKDDEMDESDFSHRIKMVSLERIDSQMPTHK